MSHSCQKSELPPHQPLSQVKMLGGHLGQITVATGTPWRVATGADDGVVNLYRSCEGKMTHSLALSVPGEVRCLNWETMLHIGTSEALCYLFEGKIHKVPLPGIRDLAVANEMLVVVCDHNTYLMSILPRDPPTLIPGGYTRVRSWQDRNGHVHLFLFTETEAHMYRSPFKGGPSYQFKCGSPIQTVDLDENRLLLTCQESSYLLNGLGDKVEFQELSPGYQLLWGRQITSLDQVGVKLFSRDKISPNDKVASKVWKVPQVLFFRTPENQVDWICSPEKRCMRIGSALSIGFIVNVCPATQLLSSSRVALVGLPGSGKTCALQKLFYSREASTFDFVFWFHGEKPLRDQYQQVQSILRETIGAPIQWQDYLSGYRTLAIYDCDPGREILNIFDNIVIASRFKYHSSFDPVLLRTPTAEEIKNNWEMEAPEWTGGLPLLLQRHYESLCRGGSCTPSSILQAQGGDDKPMSERLKELVSSFPSPSRKLLTRFRQQASILVGEIPDKEFLSVLANSQLIQYHQETCAYSVHPAVGEWLKLDE